MSKKATIARQRRPNLGGECCLTRESLNKANPCPECYGWWLSYSTCDHKKYICSTCGRPQCLLHWRYPMESEDEAVHFLRGAEVSTGKRCFVRSARVPTGGEKWKVFTSEEDYWSYVNFKKHKR